MAIRSATLLLSYGNVRNSKLSYDIYEVQILLCIMI